MVREYIYLNEDAIFRDFCLGCDYFYEETDTGCADCPAGLDHTDANCARADLSEKILEVVETANKRIDEIVNGIVNNAWSGGIWH